MGAAMMSIPGVFTTAAEVTAAVGVASIGGVVNVAGERAVGKKGKNFGRTLLFSTGWWFGTCFIFSISWEFHHPN